MENKKAHVYEAINKITEEMAGEGIAKTKQTKAGDAYKYRGIEDVMGAICRKLATNKLCILPRVVARDVRHATSKHGTAMVYTVLDVEFDFVSAVDGSVHTVRTVGEAMDMSDKSSNKAMSVAYKYATLLAFCIPIVGDNTEEESHELIEQPKQSEQKTLVASPSDAKQKTEIPKPEAINRMAIIPVGLTVNGQTDWPTWGTAMANIIKTIAVRSQLENFLTKNKNAMETAKNDYPAGYAKLQEYVADARTRLTTELPTLKKD